MTSIAVIIRFKGRPDTGNRASGQGLHRFIHEAGLPEPTQIKRLWIEGVGWD